jgi:hypothetical protein
MQERGILGAIVLFEEVVKDKNAQEDLRTR